MGEGSCRSRHCLLFQVHVVRLCPHRGECDPRQKPQFDVTTKSSWVEKVRSGREKYDSVEINDLKVLFNGDLATVTGAYSQKGSSDGKESAAGVFT